jgi:murein L,D-transpeptidase YafK
VDLAHERGLPLPLPSPSIRVTKSAHKLELRNAGIVLKSYPVGLGHDRAGSSMAEAGPKRREGDCRTPEGTYRIVSRHDRGPYHLWLGLSYPSAEDAERGLAEGAITTGQRDAIVRADRAGAEPPAKTALGGEVGIHGGGSASDWTIGCIALDNGDVEELWRAVPDGTAVEIVP